jgi:hypothetical protein
VAAGAVEDVVGRFVVGHQVQLQVFGQRRRQRHEAHEGMQVVGFAADLLDAPLQLAAQAVAGQHGGAVAVGDAPEHFVQQVPALFAAVAPGLLQLGQQGRRHPGMEGAWAFGAPVGRPAGRPSGLGSR